jgi:ADP-ribose pyrophosphatase YjhB (NUDIX family)
MIDTMVEMHEREVTALRAQIAALEAKAASPPKEWALLCEVHDAVCPNNDATSADVIEQIRATRAALGAGADERLCDAAKRATAQPKDPLMRVCVVGLVTNANDRILLIYHRNRDGWELPGGKLKKRPDGTVETWQEALRREMKEETGLDVAFENVPCAVPNGVPVPGATYASIILVVRGRADGEPVPGDDAAKAVWFAVDEIPWADLSRIGSAETVRQWASSQEHGLRKGEHRPGCEYDGNPFAECCGDAPSTAFERLEVAMTGLRKRDESIGAVRAAWQDFLTAREAEPERPRIDDPIVRKRVQGAGE